MQSGVVDHRRHPHNGEAGRGNCWAAQIIRDRAEPYAALHIARIAGRDE
jgi:hypothetical protein